MLDFVIVSDELELPRHTRITVREAPCESGDLVLFRVGRRLGLGRLLQVGRFKWFVLPGLLLRFVKRAVHIIGKVIAARVARPCWN